ncbi:DUF6913 domain-containing protein [Marinoscillum furvescens]|uniref:Uncharacterized protein n=1 Tax=Marinoscillum furvescens DSM 4134 TaxID=1122208 RepID=A0A3D9L1I8_MARFU|nr:hypothetical protein [Marinoscillum furvescens]RED94403.1 hypothetical protein C7460_12190 [Marinoscillum furvescens DSM 4134]
MGIFKKPYLQYKAKKNLKRRVPKDMRAFQESEKIAILASDQFESSEQLEKLIADLKNAGKEVHVMVYNHTPKQGSPTLPHFTATDISASGKYEKEELVFFLKQSYDFAICLDETRHFLIDYVFSLLNAKCRVGLLQPDRNHFFELMIHSTTSDKPASSEVLKYLKMIQSYEY